MSHDPMPQSSTQVTEIVVNLDDVTGELIGDAQQALLAAGALDVWTSAIQMKKGRPGVMLSLLCEEAKRDELAKLVIELTGSFGVRFREWGRLVLDRRHITVDTRFGKVRIKVGELDGRIIIVRPEFEDVKKLADASGTGGTGAGSGGGGASVREVYDAAQSSANIWRETQR